MEWKAERMNTAHPRGHREMELQNPVDRALSPLATGHSYPWLREGGPLADLCPDIDGDIMLL